MADAFEVLHQMHLDAKSAFQKIQQASPDERGGLWAKLRPELEAHEQIEERFVYDPAVKDVGHDQLVQSGHHKHERQTHEATQLIQRIAGMEPRASAWLEQVRLLQEMLERHIEWEETDFWPLIRRTWGNDKVEEAGGKVQAAKTAAAGGAAASGAMGKAAEAAKDVLGR